MCVCMYIYTYTRIHVHKFTEQAREQAIRRSYTRYIFCVFWPNSGHGPPTIIPSWEKINSISQKLTRENLGHLRLPSSSKICRFSAPFRTLSISKEEDAWRDPCCRAGSGAGQSGACVDLGATLLGRILERDRGHDPLLGPGQPVAED